MQFSVGAPAPTPYWGGGGGHAEVGVARSLGVDVVPSRRDLKADPVAAPCRNHFVHDVPCIGGFSCSKGSRVGRARSLRSQAFSRKIEMLTDHLEATEVLRRMIEAFSSGDVAAVPEFVSPKYVDHQGLRGIDIRGQEGFARVVSTARRDYASLRVVVQDLFGEGDRAVARLLWLGEKSDRSVVERETIDMIRVVDGKAVGHWGGRCR